MDGKNFKLMIISPEEMCYNGDADFLEFTSVSGEMGVYKNHIPLTTILEPCVMKIHKGPEMKKAAVLGGFVEILQEQITVLAEDVEWPDEIDVERADRSEKRARERLAKKENGIDVARAEASLKRALARKNTVR